MNIEIFTIKKNQIGSAVRTIFRYTHTCTYIENHETGEGGIELNPNKIARTISYISCHDVSPQGISMQGHTVLNQVSNILMSYKEKLNKNLSLFKNLI